MKNAKKDVVSFKADEALLRALKGIPNRSAFIRNALLSALDGACPLCKGTGILTPDQKQHWASFASSHSVEECDMCHAVHLVCLNHAKGARRGAHGGKAGGGKRTRGKA